ncbi:hypothetical protein Pelo_1194 [Pelomyxa schiedti]|nr:hypothetical protein Pelo_1194 [Pelomyxa schiedti]
MPRHATPKDEKPTTTTSAPTMTADGGGGGGDKGKQPTSSSGSKQPKATATAAGTGTTTTTSSSGNDTVVATAVDVMDALKIRTMVAVEGEEETGRALARLHFPQTAGGLDVVLKQFLKPEPGNAREKEVFETRTLRWARSRWHSPQDIELHLKCSLKRAEEVFEIINGKMQHVSVSEAAELEEWLNKHGFLQILNAIPKEPGQKDWRKEKMSLSHLRKLSVQQIKSLFNLSLGKAYTLWDAAKTIEIATPLNIHSTKTKVEVIFYKMTLLDASEELNQFQARVLITFRWPITKHCLGHVDPDSVWHPQFTFANCVSRETLIILRNDIEATADAAEKIALTTTDGTSRDIEMQIFPSSNTGNTAWSMLKYTLEFQGDFHEIFELGQFPLDRQLLHVELQLTEAQVGSIQFIDSIGSEAGTGQVIQRSMGGGNGVMDCGGEEWRKNDLILNIPLERSERGGDADSTPSSDVASLILTGSVQRRYKYYLWNTICPLFMIVAMNYVVFCFSTAPTISYRLEISTAIIGTIIFFKFATGAAVTKTEYLTMLDKYFIISFIVSFALMGGNVVVTAMVYRGKSEYVRYVDACVAGITGGFWVLLHVLLILFRDLLRKQWVVLQKGQLTGHTVSMEPIGFPVNTDKPKKD